MVRSTFVYLVVSDGQFSICVKKSPVCMQYKPFCSFFVKLVLSRKGLIAIIDGDVPKCIRDNKWAMETVTNLLQCLISFGDFERNAARCFFYFNSLFCEMMDAVR